MSATVVRAKRQTTLPEDICQAAGIKVRDQVEWRVEDGEIRGRVLKPRVPKVIVHRPKLVRRHGQLVFDAPAVPGEAIAQAVRELRDEQ
jgi:bifunctional DNA-binding transcriptional regulator/antitoxin component of YhaV-PrlF toxin-antitoxin module